jgi:hypothetical protein
MMIMWNLLNIEHLRGHPAFNSDIEEICRVCLLQIKVLSSYVSRPCVDMNTTSCAWSGGVNQPLHAIALGMGEEQTMLSCAPLLARRKPNNEVECNSNDRLVLPTISTRGELSFASPSLSHARLARPHLAYIGFRRPCQLARMTGQCNSIMHEVCIFRKHGPSQGTIRLRA